MNSLSPFFDDTLPTEQEASDDSLKLQMLRSYDSAHAWTSLDDERVCVLCGHEFRGREIEIVQDLDESSCKCPTPGCAGDHRHFVLPGNPLLDETAWTEWMTALGDDEVSAESGSAV